MKKLFASLTHTLRCMISFGSPNEIQQNPEKLAFRLGTSGSKAVRDLAQLTETTNFIKLIQIALATYNMLVDHVRDGGTIILRDKDTSERLFDPINFKEVGDED